MAQDVAMPFGLVVSQISKSNACSAYTFLSCVTPPCAPVAIYFALPSPYLPSRKQSYDHARLKTAWNPLTQCFKFFTNLADTSFYLEVAHGTYTVST